MPLSSRGFNKLRHRYSLPAHFRPSGLLARSVPRMPDLGDHLRRGAAGRRNRRPAAALLKETRVTDLTEAIRLSRVQAQGWNAARKARMTSDGRPPRIANP